MEDLSSKRRAGEPDGANGSDTSESQKPWLHRDLVTGIEQNAREISAHTRVPISPWGARFGVVHSGDSLIPIEELASRLCGHDDRIVTIEQLRWNGLLNQQMALTVSLDPIAVDSTQGKPVIAAIAKTKHGQKLFISAHPNGTPAENAGTMSENPHATRIVDAQKTSPDIKPVGGYYSFPTHALPRDSAASFLQGSGRALISTFLDSIIIASESLRMRKVIETNGIRVLAGIENMNLPTPEELAENEGGSLEVRPRHDQTRPLPSGLVILPVEACFRDVRGNIKASGVLNTALSPSRAVTKAFFSRVPKRDRSLRR